MKSHQRQCIALSKVLASPDDWLRASQHGEAFHAKLGCAIEGKLSEEVSMLPSCASFDSCDENYNLITN